MPKFRIAPEGYIFTAVAMLLIPLRFLAALFLAVAVHELGHWLALWMLGVKVYRVSFQLGGCVMETGGIQPLGELICALAGPVASASLLLFLRWIPLTAIFAAIHAAYNLIPVYPLDGGRVMRSGLCLILGEKAGEILCGYIEFLVVLLFPAVGIAGFMLLDLGIVPLLISAVVCLRILLRKIPCKRCFVGVQ